VPKIISKRCELVKLYHINHSGPVFETQCRCLWQQSVEAPSGERLRGHGVVCR